MVQTTTTILQEELQHKIDFKTKPVGALGRLEEVALLAGLLQNTLSPKVTKPHIIVFAADHGIAATGLVNPYPQAVTAQMVLNFINGGAAINVFCKQSNIELKIVDSGVNYEFDGVIASPNFIKSKVAPGTKNYLKGAAMSEREAIFAIEKGKEIVQHIAATGCNTIGFGEMGIGNTSSAALIMSAVTRLPVEACTGRGTGVSDEGLKIKTNTLKSVYDLHNLNDFSNDPLQLLSKIGGFEIAMMTGAYIEARHQNMIIVVDGFIATAALLLAQQMDDAVLRNCIFAHNSGEEGHEKMLHYLNAKPLLQLGMRLGEGTGAALAIPLIQSAVAFLNHMASFETAAVSNKE